MGLAKFFCWFGIVSCVILGIVIIAGSDQMEETYHWGTGYTYTYGKFYGFAWLGFITLLLGPFICWMSSWVMYAIGEITDNVEELKAAQSKIPASPVRTAAPASPVRTAASASPVYTAAPAAPQPEDLSAELPDL